jgi:hypothetical protein
MQYMLLIYANESEDAERYADPATAQSIIGAYRTYTDELKSSGVLVRGDALKPTSTATTVRVTQGKAMHTDGPFAETKEQLGGYYLLECKDLDDALRWAEKCPGAAHGSIEVRPVMVFE